MINNKMYDIILKPVRTEKAFKDLALKKYVFIVAKKATKTEIKAAVEQIFDVDVKSVNTINCRGKLKRQGKYEGFQPDYKKAIVQLKDESKTIKFFDDLQ